jgi:serine phosphatase RsbU (regulator of sigma subunit)
VTLANAGHVPPLVYRKASGTLEEAMTREAIGFPLGVLETMEYQTAELELAPGDVVVLISDGVSDAQNREEKDFGIAGVRAAIDQAPHTPQAIGQRLMNAVRQFSAGRKLHDDVTIVCFGRT